MVHRSSYPKGSQRLTEDNLTAGMEIPDHLAPAFPADPADRRYLHKTAVPGADVKGDTFKEADPYRCLWYPGYNGH